MNRKEIFELLCIERVDSLLSAISDDTIFVQKIKNYSSVDREFELILDLTDKIIEKCSFFGNSELKSTNIYHEFKKEDIL